MKMKFYYEELFPFENMYTFLRLSPFRELTFRFDNTFFQRYISVKSLDYFRNLIMTKTPSQIDVGPIYKSIPQKHTKLEVNKRELVFDVDITDYKRLCECEKSENRKKLCNECFQIIKAAIGVLDFSLRHHFGYKHILFVYSGGKGVHCWVMDKEAMDLSMQERKGIMGFLKNAKSFKRTIKNNEIQHFESLPFYFEEILERFNVKIQHYLVLDKEVTANMKHLIKMPFSVHSNGNVSVPININTIDGLCLEDFPTLQEVYENKQILTPFLDFFRDFVKGIQE